MQTRELREQTLEMMAKVVDQVAERDSPLFHSSFDPLPQRREMVSVLRRCGEVLFPGYFGEQELYKGNLRFHLGDQLYVLARQLRREVGKALLMPSRGTTPDPDQAEERASEVVFQFMKGFPGIMELVADDVAAAYDGDPAATGPEEIVIAYPGVKAVWIYRIAHLLYALEVPLIPRIMTEWAHSLTGVDIHPGAAIGHRLSIDHATGEVIGEMSEIATSVASAVEEQNAATQEIANNFNLLLYMYI